MKKIFLLVVTSMLFGVLWGGCGKQEGGGKVDSKVDYYTCPMHPSVHSPEAKAKCPFCGMDLVPVLKKSATHQHSNKMTKPNEMSEQPGEVMIAPARLHEIGVTFATVEKKPLQRVIRAVGTVAYDKQRHWDYVARVEGYVQKLQVFSRGEMVEKGQPLLTIYSPDLLTTQREFVNLLQLRDRAKKTDAHSAAESDDRLIESAKRRLALWNISEEEIAELEKTREPKETLTLYSPFRGVAQDIAVDQGRRVMVGDHLVDVVDLSSVWVWAEFYQEELSLLKTNLVAAITSSSFPGGKFSGKIDLIDPFLNDAKRTVRVRLVVDNPDFKLRPEMFVNAELEVGGGEGLMVPVSAVMPTGERNLVFVNQGDGKLEPRFIEIGGKFGTNYLVKTGLAENDSVVNSANFLIDAEAKLQGALQSW